MFILRTGLQGHSKTLNTIKEVDQKAAKEGRTVYYHNVTGFKADHPALKASWMPFDDPTKWFDLPDNAIIVIDEAQTWFRIRPQGSRVPEYASRLEIMRKQGHELHAITQSPKLIDSHMRELCGRHVHYHRGQGGNIVKRWEFQKPELDVNKKFEFTDGESSRITIDSTYFGVYESVKETAAHHFKFKPPRALYVLIGCAVLLVLAAWKLSGRFVGEPVVAPEPVTEEVKANPAPVASSGGHAAPQTAEQYIKANTPLIPDVPSSAPIYAELTRPVSFPKPVCIASTDKELIARNARKMMVKFVDGDLTACRCNTQQGTRMDVSFDFCLSVVENGYFDNTRPDRQGYDVLGERTEGRGRRPDGVALAQPAQPLQSQGPSITVIPHEPEARTLL